MSYISTRVHVRRQGLREFYEKTNVILYIFNIIVFRLVVYSILVNFQIDHVTQLSGLIVLL